MEHRLEIRQKYGISKMLSIFLLVCLGYMLIFPNIVFDGASTGLMLWFQTVLPTLFPFFVINALLFKSGTIYRLSLMLSPIFAPLFSISKWASYAVLSGFFCGAPIGAMVIAELVQNGKISRREGEYLLSFCNNTSPGFIVGFLFDRCLHRPELAYPSLGILIISYVLSSFLFRKMYYSQVMLGDEQEQSVYKMKHRTRSLEESIWESCETILKIGGYIISFCVILTALKAIPCSGKIWTLLVLPCLELTNGIKMIAEAEISFSARYTLSMALVSFGGICAGFQTKCMIESTGLSFRQYIKEKLITAMVTSLLAINYITLYNHSFV